MKLDDIKPQFNSMEKTNKAYSSGWGTYNEAGFTYNEAGYTYGGIYESDAPVVKFYKVEVAKPV